MVSLVSVVSVVSLVRRIPLGIWIARYWPVSNLQLVSKPCPSILGEFGGVLYTDHVRFYLGHPYNLECLPAL